MSAILQPCVRLVNSKEYTAINVADIMKDMIDALNQTFVTAKCTNAYYTLNTDNIIFGVRVNPMITKSDIMKIVMENNEDDEPVKFRNYEVEIDSRLLQCSVSGEELEAIILHDVAAMIDTPATIDRLKDIIAANYANQDVAFSIRKYIDLSDPLNFAIKDTLNKITSFLFVFTSDIDALRTPEMFKTDDYLADRLREACVKVFNSEHGADDSVLAGNFAILDWVIDTYRDIDGKANPMIDTLKEAINFTGSMLDRKEIDKCIKGLQNLKLTTVTNENANIFKFFDKKNVSSINEISFFANLKRNGLRTIENDLYEYSMRVKNCETEEDAMYILRGVNTRISMLDDYVFNTPELSQSERDHWNMVSQKFRDLRELLIKKKISNKKQYGIFIDYDKLDKLDDPNEE